MKQILTCFTVLGFFITNSAMADTSKPNVVYIMADDLGWGDISAHGGGVATPKIDALFKQGIELTQFMCWCVCSPTRAMLLTGRHPFRVGTRPEVGGELAAAPARDVLAADAPKPRNLLVITADDMNADSGGWSGNKLGATPNLDAFANTAHRFVNSHVTVPICQPCRSALMTGRVPHRNGAIGFNPIRADGRHLSRSSATTVTTPQVRTEFVSSVDVMPSVLELLDVLPPVGMDGRSWVPLLMGETQSDRDFVSTHVNTVRSGKSFAQRCIRTKDRALMFHPWVDGQTKFRVEAMSGLSFVAMNASTDAKIQARVKQLVDGESLMLFDTAADPTERKNLINDPKYANDVEELSKKLLAHMRRTDDPQTKAFEAVIAKK